MSREWTLDDARRDALVQASVTEFHNWRAGDWLAFQHALAAAFAEVARQKASAGECDAAWGTLHQISERLKAP